MTVAILPIKYNNAFHFHFQTWTSTHTQTRSKSDNWNQLVCVLKDHIVSSFQALLIVKFGKRFILITTWTEYLYALLWRCFYGSWSPSKWPNTPRNQRTVNIFFVRIGNRFWSKNAVHGNANVNVCHDCVSRARFSSLLMCLENNHQVNEMSDGFPHRASNIDGVNIKTDAPLEMSEMTKREKK